MLLQLRVQTGDVPQSMSALIQKVRGITQKGAPIQFHGTSISNSIKI
jgi:hypothetical protein